MTARAPRPLSVAVLALALAMTGALTALSLAAREHSTERLLTQQVQQTGAALASEVPLVQAQLADAAEVANATNGRAAVFTRFVTPKLSAGGPFAGVSLWRVTRGRARELAHVGAALALPRSGAAQAYFQSLHPSASLFVTGLLSGGTRLGYAEMPPGEASGLVVYAERDLPPHHRIAQKGSSPFADLRLALYLGNRPVRAQLLESTAPVPIRGQTASVSLPFGDRTLLLVAANDGELAGAVLGSLPWIVLGVGVALALTSASTVEYVMRRRLIAERYARENERLYREQRGLVGAFQQALLPEVKPLPGVEVAARYLAGVRDVDVGGDWYDLIETEPGRCVFVVGDVSGRGLPAATMMASLRYAIRAYVAQGDELGVVLDKLAMLVDVDRDACFATVLIGELDLAGGELRLAAAGHLPPLLVEDGEGRFVEVEIDPPIGVQPRRGAKVSTLHVPAGATLVAFSDGLVERRGEVIDAGLDRLRRAAQRRGTLEEVVDALMAATREVESQDDTVVLALRW